MPDLTFKTVTEAKKSMNHRRVQRCGNCRFLDTRGHFSPSFQRRCRAVTPQFTVDVDHEVCDHWEPYRRARSRK